MTRLLALIAALVLLAGCGGEKKGAEKYTQTWRQPYESTTCAQWASEMTDAQRFAAAADMLVGAREVWGEPKKLPSDALINAVAADVSDTCTAAPKTWSISELAATMFITDKDRYYGKG